MLTTILLICFATLAFIFALMLAVAYGAQIESSARDRSSRKQEEIEKEAMKKYQIPDSVVFYRTNSETDGVDPQDMDDEE